MQTRTSTDHADSRGRMRSESWTVNDGPSMTIQSDAQEASITHILRKYNEVGLLEHLNQAEAVFMDVTEFTDLADAMRQMKTAEGVFMRLPSKVREIFGHDVANWLDAAHDPEKRAQLEKAGFIEPAEIDIPEVVPPVTLEPVAPEPETEQPETE